jgi:type I restriction enzyme, R subunit
VVYVPAIPLQPAPDALGLDGKGAGRQPVVDRLGAYPQIIRREKDRLTIEQTFEALIKLVQDLDHEETRGMREGLDEESLALFDLLKKSDLGPVAINKIKKVTVELLATLKAGKLKIYQWRDLEATLDAVRVAIHNFLYHDDTGLPVDSYTDEEVIIKSDLSFKIGAF